MNTSLYRFLFCTLLYIALAGCGTSDDKTPVYDYDVYEVQVRSNLLAREAPSKRSPRVGRFPNGTRLPIYEIENGWGRTEYQGRPCYVSADYIVLVQKLKVDSMSMLDTPDETKNVADASTNIPNVENTPAKENDAVAQSVLEEENTTLAPPPTTRLVIIDSLHVLTPDEKTSIAQAIVGTDMTWYVMTVPSIPRGQIFDYTEDHLEVLAAPDHNKKGFWKRLFTNATEKSVLICYDAADKMLTIESGNYACKYMSLSRPNDLFVRQAGVRYGYSPGTAIHKLVTLFVESYKKFQDSNFLVVSGVCTGSFFDYICGETIVENILPRDSFWHKWVLGLIFAYPFALSNVLFNATGSLCFVLILFVLLYGIWTYGYYILTIKKIQTQKKIYNMLTKASYIIQIFMYLTLISFAVYMFPKMENIVVMENYGYSQMTVSNIYNLYTYGTIVSGWFLYGLFLIVALVKFCVKADYAVIMLYPSDAQRRIYKKNRSNVEMWLMTCEIDIDVETLDKDDYPFVTLTMVVFLNGFIKHLLPAISAIMIFNNCLLVYATVFMMSFVVSKTVVITSSVREGRRLGMI